MCPLLNELPEGVLSTIIDDFQLRGLVEELHALEGVSGRQLLAEFFLKPETEF